MWIEDLATYIRGENVDGIADNVFVYTLRADEYGAMLTTHTQGVLNSPEIPDRYKGPLQLIVRQASAKASLAQAQAISNLLSSHEKRKVGADISLELDTVIFSYIYPRHLPVVYPRSEGDFYETSVNFDVCFVDISA